MFVDTMYRQHTAHAIQYDETIVLITYENTTVCVHIKNKANYFSTASWN